MPPLDQVYEYIRIEALDLTPSQLVWRRYKRPAPTILGRFLDANPHLAPALGEGPYIPINIVVRMPIDDRILAGKPRVVRTTNFVGATV